MTNTLVPYSCIFIDTTLKQLSTAILNCFSISDQTKENDLRRKLCHEINSLFVRPSNMSPAIVCLSARTAFDLFFRTKRFTQGSEVIMSAINIPGMVDIVREHGLIPVPWDINIDTLSPSAAALDFLITDRTVVIVLSHIFGKRCNVDAAVGKAKRHGLYFVEDCAEIFDGFEYLGNHDSDLVLFSFGTIKHFTAFGGSVCKIKDRELYDEMSMIYSNDPEQSRLDYLTKLRTVCMVAMALNVPLVMRLGVPVANLIGLDYKNRAVEMLRGFPPGPDLWARLRRRPSIPLLMMMRDRLHNASNDYFRRTKEKGDFVRRLLPREGLIVPGSLALAGHDWLFPIIVENPDAVANRLNTIGVDAVIKATQLTIVGGNSKELVPANAFYLLSHVVYLPVHKNVPYEYLRRICKAVGLAISDQSIWQRNKGTVTFKSKL